MTQQDQENESEIKAVLFADLPPGEAEKEWYRSIYCGDSMKQLTLRAVLMGSVLGGFMALSNLYVGLKTGWGLGVAITSCILSYAIFKTMTTLFPRLFPSEMTILENNCMQSTASAAGYSTGGTMVSAISAYLIVTGSHIPWPVLTAWTFLLAGLGVFMAIPMKRQMINHEQLRFPSGVAAAETLRSLHSKGKEAMQKARALGSCGLVGGLVAWFRDGGKPFAIPSSIPFTGSISGIPLEKLTINFDLSTIMIAAGALMGLKTTCSMMLGAVINWGYLIPTMVERGDIDRAKIGYRAAVSWSTWTGASIMVTSGLFMFFMQWKTILRAFSGFLALFNKNVVKDSDEVAAIEVPSSWFMVGTILFAVPTIWLLSSQFDTTVGMGILAVVLSFFLAIVACRATGETDTTPVGAMGKITQLTFGFIAPGNTPANLMTASVTANVAGSAADLLTDLKSGYLLGANPRKQFIAQFLGIFAGTLVVVPAFYMLVPDAASLGTDKWPAPGAQVWAAVAKVLASGPEALPLSARWGMVIGGLIGIVIPMLEMVLPKKVRLFLPSATGIGLAMVIPFFNTLSMFIGSIIALIIAKKWPKKEGFIIPSASGFIAGESLMGVVVALLAAAGFLA